ncbi:MAG: acyl carrier protein [Deltaproteobacteria bacterium]|nr:acyl carrier protein [Deltaproteobacteria bacterium]
MYENPSTSDVYDRVKKVIAEVFNTDEAKITMETKFVEDLGAESLDIVTLLMEFEDEFDREIPDEEAEKLTTVGEAVRYIMGIVEAQGRPEG